MSYTLDELEERLAARIAALSSAPYQQAGAPAGEVWTESDTALTVAQDSALQSHLAFSVTVEDGPVVDDDNAVHGFLTVLAQVAVVYLYRLRSDDQRRDTRTAIQAARALMGAVMAPSPMWGSAMALNVYQPRDLEGEFLPVQQTYSILIDVPIP